MTELQQKTYKRYMEKSGDTMLALSSEGSFMYEDETDRAWAQYYISDDILFIQGAYCEKNIKRHYNILKSIGRDHDCSRLQFITDRNPKAFERRFGAKTIMYKMEYEV